MNADLFDLLHFEEILSRILGRMVDLISYNGLDPDLDRDILEDHVIL
ncbi:MAG: hypothetical protein WC184_01215 [Acidimicrobiia bacterium]